MPEVDINIGKRTFHLVCADGQEDHLKGLASSVSKKIEELAVSMNTHNETLLLVMAALMTQDEANELQENSPNAENITDREANLAVTEAINAISEYIEGVAKRIEKV